MNSADDKVRLPEASAEVFPFASKSVEMDSHRIAYVDEGPGETQSKGTILCVHGNPTWSFYYREVVKRFSATHRVVAVDHLGCGRSDKPGNHLATYTLRAHRDRLIQLVQALDLQHVSLLAHDWGGAIGLSTLLECRERFDRIMLLNTGAFPPPYIPLRISACRIPLLGTLAVRGLNGFARAAVKMAMSRNELHANVRNGLLAPYDSWANRVAIDAFVKDIPMKRSHPTHALLTKVEQDLPTLAEIPSLLVWGMKDWCFRPECLRRFEGAWPGSTTVEIPDAGHYVLEDAPTEVLDAIDSFLKASQ